MISSFASEGKLITQCSNRVEVIRACLVSIQQEDSKVRGKVKDPSKWQKDEPSVIDASITLRHSSAFCYASMAFDRKNELKSLDADLLLEVQFSEVDDDNNNKSTSRFRASAHQVEETWRVELLANWLI